MYTFKDSLAQGTAGELRFLAMFPLLQMTDGRKADFILPNGRKADLKTESRSTAQTANFAIELYSSVDRPGAIERAVNDNIDYIVYMFADKKLFAFLAIQLLQYIHNAKHRIVMVPNAGYETCVMLVPRAAITHLEVTKQFLLEAKNEPIN